MNLGQRTTAKRSTDVDNPRILKEMQRETLVTSMLRLACDPNADAAARVAAAQLLVNMGAV